MISPISYNTNTRTRNNIPLKQQNATFNANLSNYAKNDVFVKNNKISFKGDDEEITIEEMEENFHEYDKMYFWVWSLRIAKGMYSREDGTWEKSSKKTMVKWQRDKEIWGSEREVAGAYFEKTGEPAYFNPSDIVDRVSAAFLTLGISEFEIAIDKARINYEVNKKIKMTHYIKEELRRIEARESLVQQHVKQEDIKYRIEMEKVKDKVKQNKLYPQLIDLVQRQREGRSTDMPNSVMIVNNDKEVCRNLMNWISENVNARVIGLDADDDIDEVLEECQENYQKTKDWNILLIDGFDELLNPEVTDINIIESIKDLMSSAASDFHTTIIFQCQNPDELDKIATESHRVKIIDTNEIKTGRDLEKASIKHRLMDPEYSDKYTLSAINDLLLLTDAKISMLLGVTSHHEQYLRVIDYIRAHCKDKDIPVEDIIQKAHKNLWYLQDYSFVDTEYANKKIKEGEI